MLLLLAVVEQAALMVEVLVLLEQILVDFL
jgi:hypothetical protein